MSHNSIILDAKNISFSYGNKKVLDTISFSVKKGNFISIIGPNGSGKTTLLRILCGANPIKDGCILWNGKDMKEYSIHEKALLRAVIHQKEKLAFPFTAMETVTMGLHPHLSRFESISEKHQKTIEQAMELTHTLQFANTLVTHLSGGEFQRVMFARAIVQQPEILFLDEAMSDLDIHARIELHKLLKQLAQEKGLTILSVNHDVNTAYQFSDAVVALQNGKLKAYGPPKQVMNANFFRDVFFVKTEYFPEKGFFIYDNIEPNQKKE